MSRIRTLLIIVGAAIGLTTGAASAGGSLTIDWHTVDGGGGFTADGNFDLESSIGQHDPGVCASAQFELSGGFLNPPSAPSEPCPSDLDESGDTGFDDLLVVLSLWGPCPGCPEDLDGDGDVGFTELLTILSNWGPCP